MSRKHSEETKRKISERIKQVHASMSEEEKRKRSEKLSKSNKEAYDKDPTLRKRMSEATSNFWGKPENRKKQSENVKAYNQTPEGQERKKRNAEAVSKRHKGAKRPKKWRENMSKGISKAITEGKMVGGYFKKSKRGHYHSPKAGRIYFRSAYELKTFVKLDEDDRVVSYKTESVRVPYVQDGITRHYIIDLAIKFIDNSILLVEIKPEAFTDSENMLAKIAAAKAEYGNQFQVWTEKEIGAEDYREMLQELSDKGLLD